MQGFWGKTFLKFLYKSYEACYNNIATQLNISQKQRTFSFGKNVCFICRAFFCENGYEQLCRNSKLRFSVRSYCCALFCLRKENQHDTL